MPIVPLSSVAGKTVPSIPLAPSDLWQRRVYKKEKGGWEIWLGLESYQRCCGGRGAGSLIPLVSSTQLRALELVYAIFRRVGRRCFGLVFQGPRGKEHTEAVLVLPMSRGRIPFRRVSWRTSSRSISPLGRHCSGPTSCPTDRSDSSRLRSSGSRSSPAIHKRCDTLMPDVYVHVSLIP